MEHEGYMLRQNLYDIGLYAKKSLDALESVDVIPDWIHHKLGAARTNMKDVGHFVRFQVHEGRRFSGKDKHTMCHEALINIKEYAQLMRKALERGDRKFPEWALNKISVTADYMDCVGHYLENRAGRRFGGPAWQTQEFQKDFPGHRVYGGVEKVIYDTRGVAAVGGVRWVPPPALPGQPYRGQRKYGTQMMSRTAPQRGPQGPKGPVGHVFAADPRRYGASFYAGQAGVAQAPHPGGCIRGGRNKKGLKRGVGAQHVYGSLGYGSMGDGSMDLATGGERMRRYAMTWRYTHSCPACGGDAVTAEERVYGASPELKDPFRNACVKVIGWDGKVKEICPHKRIKLDTGLRDPFHSKREPGFASSSAQDGRRKKKRRMGRRNRRYGAGEGVPIGRGPSGLAPSGKMKRLLRSKRKSGDSFAGP